MLEKPSPTGVVTGPFKPNVGALDRLDQFFGNVFVILLEGLGARLKNFPLELHAGRFQNAHGGLGNFGANAVAGNKCDLVSHIDSVWRLCGRGRLARGF